MATVVPRADDQPNYCIPDDFLDGNCIPDDFPDDNVIYPADPRSAADLAAIQNYLQTNPEGADQKWWDLQGTQQIQASSKELGGFTAFFYVPNLPWSATKDLNSMDEVRPLNLIYHCVLAKRVCAGFMCLPSRSVVKTISAQLFQQRLLLLF